MRSLWLWAGLALAVDGTPFQEEGTVDREQASTRIPDAGQIPPHLIEIAAKVALEPLPVRLEAVSEALLGRPYLIDPLGEGFGIDPDPLARYDAFDCLTFVEELLALVMAGDPTHAAEVRNHLRYGSDTPTYSNRRHFMELEWIPENLEAGWLRDATADYGQTVRLEREWTLAGWKNWGRRSLFHHSDQDLPVGQMALDVLPLEQAIAVADTIRPGSILLTVREDRPWVPLWITHVGMVFHPQGQPVLRHATKMGDGVVRDHNLTWYLNHTGTYANWKTLGVTILEPIEQGPRLGALPR